ncbi:unnamed protein product [Linum tenue]|uniref:Uncharacterized protein n=1 Tax=Linum tenue TaxID=586396 RepID=A0AAV0KTK1_9ROSI|nr:unnamed protein product [Linum tenue]
MNPSAAVDPPLLQPPQPPQAHRPSTSCPRHPEESFTGFCPSCLCERLAVLDHSASASASAASTSRKPPLATAALRAIFKPSNSNSSAAAAPSLKPSSFFPELRRTKSFSASKNEGFSGVFEPQRKSCDVRGRSTLWSLFSQDDDRNPGKEIDQPRASTSSIRAASLFKSSEDGEIETESEVRPDINARVAIDEAILTARNSNAKPIEEIIEEEDEEEEEEEEEEAIVAIEPEPAAVQEEEEEILKPMKDHIDLDSQTKKPSSGSFWSAASVFSKKLQKWRQKQKMKKRRNGGGPGSATLPVEKPIGRQYRETQSEIADYGFGRRSCDTDPRFSLDAGRISFDDPRYSFDEPRASWDGYLIGRTFPRMPTMLSVVEDAPVNVVPRSDAQIPVEDPTPPAAVTTAEDETTVVPGGSIQTRDYYSDSSSRRRKSLDRSNSIRKTAAAVVAEIDELKSSVSSNSKVSPATVESCPKLPAAAVVPPDRDWRDSNSNSLRDDCSVETFDLGFRDNASAVASSANGKAGVNKKSRRWGKAWNIWGFIHRRSGNKDDDEDSRYSRVNGVERSFSESWPELRGGRNGDARMGAGFNNPKLLRSNSSLSWRHSNGFATVGGGVGVGSFGSGRKSNVETCSNNGFGIGRKKREEFVLERNRSARYSPSSVDNGLLRFYLTPLRGSRRAPASGSGGGGWGKAKTNQAHSIARSVLRLY